MPMPIIIGPAGFGNLGLFGTDFGSAMAASNEMQASAMMTRKDFMIEQVQTSATLTLQW